LTSFPSCILPEQGKYGGKSPWRPGRAVTVGRYPQDMVGLRPSRRARCALFDLMVGGIVGAMVLLTLTNVGRAPYLTLIGAGMALAVLLRRRYPLSVMAVVSALALIQVIVYPPRYDPMPFDLAVLIAMYSVVKYTGHLWHAYLAAAVVAIGIAIEVARHASQGWYYAVPLYTAICAAVWLSGYTVRTRRLYVATLEERAATLERERENLARIAVADERAVIARELHDVVAHSLAVMIVQADGASYALDGDPEQARIAIKQVAATGRNALEDMRRLVGVLRGTASGSEAAADDRRRVGLDQVESLVDGARSAGLAVTVKAVGERPEAVPQAAQLTVYRLVQEALTNVLRHAGPAAVVELVIGYRPEAITLQVTDDGAGQLTGEPMRAGGHGLVGMRERVAVHGGSFEAGTRLGGGWQVAAEVPWA
jgi:signal transduction histidine kinase